MRRRRRNLMRVAMRTHAFFRQRMDQFHCVHDDLLALGNRQDDLSLFEQLQAEFAILTDPRFACSDSTPSHILHNSLLNFDGSVVIAVIAMRMMEVSVHEVIHMIAMRYRFVSTPFAMHVRCIMR